MLEPTAYGNKLFEVIRLQENRQFDEVVEQWDDIIRMNNHFDLAYLGLGKVMLEEGRYSEAMDYFKLINNQTYYSRAYQLNREGFLESFGILLIVGAVVLIVLLVKWFQFARAYNERVRLAGAQRTTGQQLMYGFHVIFHPFDGFWDLKHERRGFRHYPARRDGLGLPV